MARRIVPQPNAALAELLARDRELEEPEPFGGWGGEALRPSDTMVSVPPEPLAIPPPPWSANHGEPNVDPEPPRHEPPYPARRTRKRRPTPNLDTAREILAEIEKERTP